MKVMEWFFENFISYFHPKQFSNLTKYICVDLRAQRERPSTVYSKFHKSGCTEESFQNFLMELFEIFFQEIVDRNKA